ncbi:MAG: sel1 repeat family protein [Myxococcales bacterium]|nr:sel1 repeat family protein [Myxococcales bacterium]
MKTPHLINLAALFVLFAVPACKSKLEKCEGVCDKIRAEDEAACAGDKACLEEAAAKNKSCYSLCDTAVGSGAKKSGGDDEKKGDSESGSPADKDEGACERGDAEACANIGGRYLLGKDGRTKDETKGATLLKKACDLGSGFGCEIYGRALNDGRGVAKDLKAADEAFTKACEKKSGGACRSLALRLETTDPKRIPLLEKACDLDDGIGCMGLGAAYLHGNQGAAKDLAKAKSTLQKSCKLGTKGACEKAAEIP